MFEPPAWLPWILLAWAALWTAASVVYRTRAGKPIWYRDPADAVFLEKRASGVSHRTWYTKLGGARNALAVAVTPTHLVVRPLVPFNLLFLPEVYGLEAVVPLGQVREVVPAHAWGRDVVEVAFVGADGALERLSLRLRKQDAFLAALERVGAPADTR